MVGIAVSGFVHSAEVNRADRRWPDSSTPNFSLQTLNWNRNVFWDALVRTPAHLARASLSSAAIEWPRLARTGRLTYKSTATAIGALTPGSA
jgi:hypothetical protein